MLKDELFASPVVFVDRLVLRWRQVPNVVTLNLITNQFGRVTGGRQWADGANGAKQRAGSKLFREGVPQFRLPILVIAGSWLDRFDAN